jgi:hypothetical protein
MTDFLKALKTDLLDRRLRLLLGLLVAGLVAALVYAATGAGGSSSAPPVAPPVGGLGSSGIAASAAGTNSNEAVAEVTSGAAVQRGGLARDPFAFLPGVLAKTTTTPAASTSSTSKSKGTSSSSSSASKAEPAPSSKSGGSAGPTTPAPNHHVVKPETVYKVSMQLGQLPAGTPPQNAQLSSYQDVRVHQRLPSVQQPLLSFDGVTASGHRASFKLETEAIPRGPAVCVPSPNQCEAIALKPGESEELEYVQSGVAPVVYLLKVVSIEAVSAPGRGVKAAGVAARVSSRPLLDETGHPHSPAAVVLVREEPARPTVETVVVVPQGR